MAGAPPNLPHDSFQGLHISGPGNQLHQQPQGGQPNQGNHGAPQPSGGAGVVSPSSEGSPSTSVYGSLNQSNSMTDSMLLTPEGMDCYGNERQAFAEQTKFFNNPLLSDVSIKVGRRTYFAHKLVLVRASDVFDRMMTSPSWQDSGKKEIELIEEGDCVKMFPRFLKFLYSCHIVLNQDNSLPMLILSDKYNVIDLKHVCIQFSCLYIIPKLPLKDVFHVWFQYATKCCHRQMIDACITAMANKMEDIISSPEWESEWQGMDTDQLLEFLQSSELVISDEYKLWCAVLKWLQTPSHPERISDLENYLVAVAKHVRFPMMTPDELCELEKHVYTSTYPHLFQPYITQAYKFHALSLNSRVVQKEEFSAAQFLLRNYKSLRWDKRLVIYSYSHCNRSSEVALRFNTKSSSFPAQTWEWELKVYPKGISNTSEDFRCIIYCNLVLDQSRAVEFLLSVVDNNRILSTVCGKKTFTKNRYTADTEIDKKITVSDLSTDSNPYLVNDNLILQITLKPVE